MSNETSDKRSRWPAIVSTIVALALTVFIVLEVVSDLGDPEPELTIAAEAAGEATMEPGRFLFDDKVVLTVRGQPVGTTPCVLTVDRGGAILLPPSPLEPGSAIAASTLARSHYGPLWVLAAVGPDNCDQLATDPRAFVDERPRASFGRQMEERGWSWGAERVYIHDKIQ